MQLENENRRLTELLESRTPTAEPNPTQHREQRSVSVVRTVSQPRPATAPVSNGADSSVWATVARRAPKKKTTAKPRSVESAARAFQEPTGPSGFDYIYIPRSRRLTRKEVRTRLQTMKVDPYRVLDITFPARSVVGLLIHAQYKDTLLDRLAKANIRPRLDFDPCDPKYIADPKHEHKTLEERETIAITAHSNRCLLGLERLRFPVAAAVGNAFVTMGYIDHDELNNLIAKSPDAPTSNTRMFSSNEQDKMDSTPSTNNPSTSSIPLTIGLWNANGLQESTAEDLLRHCQSFSLVFITETWLLQPHKIRTEWPQFNVYGSRVPNSYRGSQGVSALVSPACPMAAVQFPVHTKRKMAHRLGGRRKNVKKGFQFTLMVVGATGTGRTTFVNTLCDSNVLTKKLCDNPEDAHQEPGINIKPVSIELDEDGVRISLTIVDTPGFGDNIDNEKCFKEIVGHLERQYDDILAEESRIKRNPRFRDNRVHALLYFISPTGHALREIDIELMRRLSPRVNVIPVIGRADSLTPQELRDFKKRIMEDIEHYSIPIYNFPYDVEEDDEDTIEENSELRNLLPFSIIGSDEEIIVNDRPVRGRQYPWGAVEVDNPRHSDFGRLKSALLSSHLQDLKEITHDFLYENYRTEKLSRTGDGDE
ncbi:unnamed protein product [Rhizopus stolonifer]